MNSETTDLAQGRKSANPPANSCSTPITDVRKAVQACVDKAVSAGVDPLLSRAVFKGALGVGFTKFYELAKDDPRFPKAVVLSPRCVRYRASEVQAYIEALSHTVA